MATISLTPNLKLKVSSDLTAEAKFNLYKLDELASTFRVNSNGQAVIRSIGDILFEPNSPDVGGSGVGGNVQIGSANQPAGGFTVNAGTTALLTEITTETSISSSGGVNLLANDFTLNLKAPTSLSANLTLSLPPNVGEPNQVLTSDGTGKMIWTTLAGANIGQELVVNWLSADGLSKSINHGFGSYNIMVQVIDPDDNYKTVEVDVVERPTQNTVLVTASMAPATNWIVLLKEIGNS